MGSGGSASNGTFEKMTVDSRGRAAEQGGAGRSEATRVSKGQLVQPGFGFSPFVSRAREASEGL